MHHQRYILWGIPNRIARVLIESVFYQVFALSTNQPSCLVSSMPVHTLYTRHSRNITVSANVTITITFALQNNNLFWWLDAVSIVDVRSGVKLVINGGLETGNFTAWSHCNPYTVGIPDSIGQHGAFSPHCSNYFDFRAAYPKSGFLSQTVVTEIGQTYSYSFWLGNQGAGVYRALVTWYWWHTRPLFSQCVHSVINKKEAPAIVRGCHSEVMAPLTYREILAWGLETHQVIQREKMTFGKWNCLEVGRR